ncbi:hypothetical protein E7T09_04455 [Deinococcus sp. KSM4-11]|uniref:hypothetical protein n=1 Tax=Deinococcus sp. KSM4-11 TaxID=2568654 RepID=UPI0010A2C72A|nr:hypothetical protein [Deinococcus sp. KSM4-11]THF88462.1 hypothetical protein E7T09_04455 [Deinococcus sp. KSM4-11]
MMVELLDVLLLMARVVLVMYCVRHILFVVTGTTRTYAEWSKGFGSFLYIAGVVMTLFHWEHLVPGRDVARVMNAVGFAFLVLPSVLKWTAPRLYLRLTSLEDC